MRWEEKIFTEVKEVKKATAGFVISLIAGVLILINALVFIALASFFEDLGLGFVTGIMAGFGAVGLIFAVLVIIGAILIYMPGKEVIGGILVLIFSILSIFIGGGFLIGLILGIIGGALNIAKK